MRGILSHEVVRLESYIQRIKAGVMKLQAPIETEMDGQAVALLNANNTFGQIAGYQAMTLAIGKAKQYGTGVVAVKNSNHFGIAAYYATMALKEDMVDCVLTNSSPAMAVYGTKAPLIGTNPIAIAIPAGDQFPIVLDMSTSFVARGKIRYAALTGHDIPLGWARDSDGKPTADTQVALKGSLEPVGGVKGSALSLIIDIVCGILTNTVLTGGVKNITDVSGPAKTGHFFAALDISKFINMKLFKSNVDQVIMNIKGFPAVDGGVGFVRDGDSRGVRRERDGLACGDDHHGGDRPHVEFTARPDQHAGAGMRLYDLPVWVGGAQKEVHPQTRKRRSPVAFAITEPQAGSDVMAIKSTAEDKRDHWLLNGTKTWISNATAGGINIYYAYTDRSQGSRGLSAFVLELDNKSNGITVTDLDKMGSRSSPTGEIILENTKVPKGNILGKPGDGAKIVFG